MLHGGHIGFQNGRQQTLYLINPYLPHPRNCRHIPCYCVRVLFCLRDIVKTRYLRGSILKSRLADQKSFPFKWKHWFLVSGMSDLSKNIFGYNCPQNTSKRFFLDIATLTMHTRNFEDKTHYFISVYCILLKYYVCVRVHVCMCM